MTPEHVARLYYRLFNERRFDEAGALVDPYASFHYIPTRQRLIGRAGYRALAAAWVIAFEDAVLDIASVAAIDPDTVLVEIRGRGTQTGDLVLGDQIVIPASYRGTSLEFKDRLRVQDGLITSSELDFDAAFLWRRLLGPPGS
jgi:hypothetical protein